MRTKVVVGSIVVTVALPFVGAGCKSATQKQFEREQVLIAAPLEHDPTDRVELARWWSNGTHLLRLDRHASYALFEGHNRFSRPIENGRWSQQSYAVMWLEPYNTLHVEPRRVRITRIDGRLALVLPSDLTSQPMHGMNVPPVVIEDRMIGQWNGTLGELHFSSDMRYALSPSSTDENIATVPQLRARLKGSWQVAGEKVVLRSDVPGVEPLVWPLKVSETEVVIEAPGGELTQSTPAQTVKSE